MDDCKFHSTNYTLSTRNCIYLAKDLLNNRYYVGKTEQELRNRITQHISSSADSNTKFGAIIRKYGWYNIEWTILYAMENQGALNDEEKVFLHNKETEYIGLYDALGKNGMNISDNLFKYQRVTQRKPIEQNRSYKINEATAKQIIEMLNNYMRRKDIASTLNIPYTIVEAIARRETWKHLGYDPHKRLPKPIKIKIEKKRRGRPRGTKNTISVNYKKRFTQPFHGDTNPDEIYDMIELGQLGKEIVRIKENLAKHVKRGKIKCDEKLYDAIKRGKYMCIRPELNKQIYK